MKQHLSLILLFIALIGFYSCQKTDDVLNSKHELNPHPNITFILQLQNAYTSYTEEATSAKNNPSRIGVNFDTKVNENDLHILIYDNKTYVGEVENLTFKAIGGEDSGLYTFRGNASVDLKVGTSYRFMVMANCTPPSDQAKQNNPIYAQTVLNPTNGWIPMWGVISHTVNEEKEQQLNEIVLIRAAAKIEVKLSDEVQNAGFRLTNVSINHVATQGYAFPKNWLDISSSNETAAAAAQEFFYPNTNGNSLMNVPFELLDGQNVAHTTGNRAQLYVPEYDNLTKGTKVAKLSVTMKDKDSKEYVFTDKIEFKTYKQGIPQDNSLTNIQRNTLYSFIITNVGNKLTLEANVLPWDYVEETWDYSDQLSIRGEGKLKWDAGTYSAIDEENSIVVLNPGEPLTGKFTIDTPTGATWFASFVPVTGLSTAFLFKINGKKTASGKVGEQATLKIEPVKDNITENNMAVLKIVVITPDGRTLNVMELLPTDFKKPEYTIVQIK